MFTMTFFNGFTKLFSGRPPRDCELRAWADNEYKFDADYAFSVMKKTGKAPDLGVHA